MRYTCLCTDATYKNKPSFYILYARVIFYTFGTPVDPNVLHIMILCHVLFVEMKNVRFARF